jgi:hypothetical protein
VNELAGNSTCLAQARAWRPARQPARRAVKGLPLDGETRLPIQERKGRGAARCGLRCLSQLIFAHDTFVRLVVASDLIFKLAIMIRQSSGDDIGDIGASRDIVAKGGTEKNDLADFEFVGRHVPPRARKRRQSSYAIRVGEIKKIGESVKRQPASGMEAGRRRKRRVSVYDSPAS